MRRAEYRLSITKTKTPHHSAEFLFASSGSAAMNAYLQISACAPPWAWQIVQSNDIASTLLLADLIGPLLARRGFVGVPVEVARLRARRRRHAEEQDVRAARLVSMIRPGIV
jgi:hypothetical protein